MVNPINQEFANIVWAQIWQVTALIVVIAVAVRVLCRHKPHLAYLLWMLVVVKCVTPPLWSSQTGVFSWVQTGSERTESVAAAPVSAIPFGSQTIYVDSFDFVGDGSSGGITGETDIDPLADGLSFWTVASAAWLTGVLLLSSIVLYKWGSISLRLRGSNRPADADLQETVLRVSQRLRLRRPVKIRVTPEPVGPAVFGFFRPVVILPQTLLDKLSVSGLEAILAHELVHLRRWDVLAGGLQAIVQIVWWFHPMVWWANRQISRERERCCDEEAVTGMAIAPAHYARSLLDVLDLKRELRSVFAVPGIRPVEITTQRMEDIMHRSNRFHQRTPLWCWTLFLLAAAIVLPGARFEAVANVENSQNDQAAEPKPASPERASGGLLNQLPADGAWVRFDWKTTGQNNGFEFTATKSLTISSVGQAKVDDETCRWIEAKVVRRPRSEQDVITIVKLLIPEKHLKSGQSPLDHIVAGWVQQQAGAHVAPFSNPQAFGSQTTGMQWHLELQMLLTGPLTSAKEVGKATVGSKLGNLECAGLTGQDKFVFKRLRRGGELQIGADYETRLHEKAPFGVVSCLLRTTKTLNGEEFGRTEETLTLADFGNGAESELPDHGYEPEA